MLQITTNRIDGKNRTLDLHQVKIPGSGVRAVQLPQPDLYRAIKIWFRPSINYGLARVVFAARRLFGTTTRGGRGRMSMSKKGRGDARGAKKTEREFYRREELRRKKLQKRESDKDKQNEQQRNAITRRD